MYSKMFLSRQNLPTRTYTCQVSGASFPTEAEAISHQVAIFQAQDTVGEGDDAVWTPRLQLPLQDRIAMFNAPPVVEEQQQ